MTDPRSGAPINPLIELLRSGFFLEVRSAFCHARASLKRTARATRACILIEAPISVMTLPARIVDCHHHFLAPSEPFHAFLKTLGAPVCTGSE